MTLIAMACHDTEANKRTEYTQRTLDMLIETVDFDKHRLIVIDNASCPRTKEILKRHSYGEHIKIITNEENVGTAKAINQAWRLREHGEHLIKMDNDVDIFIDGWVDEMEEVLERDISIGILGLKRKDLMETPHRADQWGTKLRMLPHVKGQKWIIVEDSEHIMGTCTMFNYRLVDKIGGLYQMDGIYGFDDTLASVRAKIAGFKLSFLPHIEIEHIDEGGDAYTEWKRKYAGEMMDRFNEEKRKFISGEKSIFVKL